MTILRTVEASVLDDEGQDNLSQQDKSAVAFVAINIKQLLEVVVAIGYGAGIDIEVKCRGQLNGLSVMLIKTVPTKNGEH